MNYNAFKAAYINTLANKYGTEEALALFYVAFEHFTRSYRSRFLYMQDLQPDESVQQGFESVLKGIELGQPIQYLTGEAHFYGLTFKVNPSVLIPRPETEELVDLVIKTVKKSGNNCATLLDIGTGSGCIAISLKFHLPKTEVFGLDTSSAALVIARFNAEAHNAEVYFIEADILTYEQDNKYDVIVSNPPYIRELEKAGMHEQVLSHEPHLALFVSNEEPLIFYKAIARFAKNQLNQDGQLFFEINEYLGQETVAMLHEAGFSSVQLLKDMQGKDRMIYARK